MPSYSRPSAVLRTWISSDAEAAEACLLDAMLSQPARMAMALALRTACVPRTSSVRRAGTSMVSGRMRVGSVMESSLCRLFVQQRFGNLVAVTGQYRGERPADAGEP